MRPIKVRIPLRCNRCQKKGFDYQEWNGQQFMTYAITPCCDNRAYEIVGDPQEFIDLLDDNGKEICESDLVRWAGEIYEIIWQRDHFGAYRSGCNTLMDWWEEFEVIGNIHENPELLKDKE